MATRSLPSKVAAINRAVQTRTSVQALIRQPFNKLLHTTNRSQSVASSSSTSSSSNPALSFPCLDQIELRSATLSQKFKHNVKPSLPQHDAQPSSSSKNQTSNSLGPEPTYTTGAHQKFHSSQPLLLDWGGALPTFDIAYEIWGKLNADRSNAILLQTGLSASSHAHSTPENPLPGWWEKFIGPGCALDPEKYFIICTNPIGSCFGSTGPSSIDPSNNEVYATRFPILTMQDIVRAQFRLLDHLRIDKLYASVGGSMGGMQSLASGALFPHRVSRIATISACARSHPYGMALRHVQRQVLMNDPHWSRGFYYPTAANSGIPPHAGMKLARQIATLTYRSSLEWGQRFGRRRADAAKPPALCPDFLIETYLDHAGEKWCLQFDANSLLYLSKAMDLFDLGAANASRMAALRLQNQKKADAASSQHNINQLLGGNHTPGLPSEPYQVVTEAESGISAEEAEAASTFDPKHTPKDLADGLTHMAHIPTFVFGATTDILFPTFLQREVAETLKRSGNTNVTYVELDEAASAYGHDTFLLDHKTLNREVGRWLEGTRV